MEGHKGHKVTETRNGAGFLPWPSRRVKVTQSLSSFRGEGWPPESRYSHRLPRIPHKGATATGGRIMDRKSFFAQLTFMGGDESLSLQGWKLKTRETVKTDCATPFL